MIQWRPVYACRGSEQGVWVQRGGPVSSTLSKLSECQSLFAELTDVTKKLCVPRHTESGCWPQPPTGSGRCAVIGQVCDGWTPETSENLAEPPGASLSERHVEAVMSQTSL